MRISPFKSVLAGALALVLTAGLAACGWEGGDGKDSTGRPELSQDLPNRVRESGELRVGTTVPFVPMEMMDDSGTEYTGIEMDLIKAVGQKLGLDVKIANSAWDGLIPALTTGRYDILASSFGDFVERQKMVTMVDILNGNIAGIASPDSAATYDEPMDLCGHTVGVETGSATVTAADRLAKECEAASRPALQVDVFPDSAQMMVALQSERIDVALNDAVVAQHLAATQPAKYTVVLEAVGTPFLYGFAVPKDEQKFAELIAKTVNDLIADGTYAQICEKYGVTGALLIDKSAVNAGTTSSASM